jgi:hypothetical protein
MGETPKTGLVHQAAKNAKKIDTPKIKLSPKPWRLKDASGTLRVSGAFALAIRCYTNKVRLRGLISRTYAKILSNSYSSVFSASSVVRYSVTHA